jgi:hypothetical protein
MANYTVFDHGEIHHGDARSILEQIRVKASVDNVEIAAMNVDQYADAMIEDAVYFVDDALLKALQAQRFDTKFDLALACLAQVPTSGVRILTVQAA